MTRDVVAFGEALLRLQPQNHERLEEALSFRVFTGGAELNTCCALASLGLKTSLFTLLPEGPLGRRVIRHLRAAGVDTSLIGTRPGRVGTYRVEYGRAPRAIDVLYDRANSTVCDVRQEDAPWEALRDCRLFFVSGITPALSPATRDLSVALAEAARHAGSLVATDLNYRSRLLEPGGGRARPRAARARRPHRDRKGRGPAASLRLERPSRGTGTRGTRLL